MDALGFRRNLGLKSIFTIQFLNGDSALFYIACRPVLQRESVYSLVRSVSFLQDIR